MEAALDRDDLRAAGHLEGELQRVFVRFRARVHEEDVSRPSPQNAASRVCRAPAYIERHRIALKAQASAPATSAPRPSADDRSRARYGMAAVEIEHLAPARACAGRRRSHP